MLHVCGRGREARETASRRGRSGVVRMRRESGRNKRYCGQDKPGTEKVTHRIFGGAERQSKLRVPGPRVFG